MSAAEGYLYYPPGFESEDHTTRRVGQVMNDYQYVRELMPGSPDWAHIQLAADLSKLRADVDWMQIHLMKLKYLIGPGPFENKRDQEVYALVQAALRGEGE